jgi:hypothetical protein
MVVLIHISPESSPRRRRFDFSISVSRIKTGVSSLKEETISTIRSLPTNGGS